MVPLASCRQDKRGTGRACAALCQPPYAAAGYAPAAAAAQLAASWLCCAAAAALYADAAAP